VGHLYHNTVYPLPPVLHFRASAYKVTITTSTSGTLNVIVAKRVSIRFTSSTLAQVALTGLHFGRDTDHSG
jgi:hypothetical protein